MNQNTQTLKFRLASSHDIDFLLNLINHAYRSEHDNSWTNEAHLVEGERIGQSQLTSLIELNQSNNSTSHLLIAESNEQQNSRVVGCVLIEYLKDDVEIGTYCIAADCQNLGYGKMVLGAAETYALKFKPDVKHFVVWVLNQRHELIDYYQRRGYSLTGLVQEYPYDAGVGTPLVELKLLEMKKTVVDHI